MAIIGDMKMIKRYNIIATDYEEMSVEKHPLGDWIKADDVQELEKEDEKLREERDQAIEILQSWADDESPWTETWAFLARISKEKEELK